MLEFPELVTCYYVLVTRFLEMEYLKFPMANDYVTYTIINEAINMHKGAILCIVNCFCQGCIETFGQGGQNKIYGEWGKALLAKI